MIKVTRMGVEDFDKQEISWILQAGEQGFMYALNDLNQFDGNNLLFSSEQFEIDSQDFYDIIQAWIDMQPSSSSKLALRDGRIINVVNLM